MTSSKALPYICWIKIGANKAYRSAKNEPILSPLHFLIHPSKIYMSMYHEFYFFIILALVFILLNNICWTAYVLIARSEMISLEINLFESKQHVILRKMFIYFVYWSLCIFKGFTMVDLTNISHLRMHYDHVDFEINVYDL